VLPENFVNLNYEKHSGTEFKQSANSYY
jgi:hypothetical protein